MSGKCPTSEREVYAFLLLSFSTVGYFRFGDGYTIFIRTTIDIHRAQVIEYIHEYIPQALVKEEHNKMIHFRVPMSISLSKIFRILEEARKELKDLMEDYTVTQVTLDDVFVNFAKMQELSDDKSCFDSFPKPNNSIGKIL